MDAHALLHQPAQPIIGREREVQHLAGLLAQPGCRLLTVVGAGGMGKTRLAQELAIHQQKHFADDVVFVALQTLSSASGLVSAITDAVGCPRADGDDPRAHLLAYLHHQQMLLILDNFEHLLDGANLLPALLSAAPDVKLLVTSREVLNVQDEWRYALGGLSVPSGSTPDEINQASAVQLFVERAQRRRVDFALEAEREHVLRICRLVDGMPLALELAAAWVDVLPCATIAGEIAHNLDLLTTRLRDVPERHHSMRATLTHSWQRLTEEQRRLFAQVSVFQGGFTYEAVRAVAGASLPLLAALVDASLLRVTPEGRYQMHELLRQFAAEQVESLSIDPADLRQRHSAYYAALVARDGAEVLGGDQLTAAAAIDAELENIRLAWQWAIEQANLAALAQMVSIIDMFQQIRSRYREGAVLMAQAVQLLSQHDVHGEYVDALVIALINQGYFQMRLGQLQAAQESIEHAQTLLDRSGNPPPPGYPSDPLLGLGFLALIRGEYQHAAYLAATARARSSPHTLVNLAVAWYIQAQSALAQGQVAQAQEAIQQALTALHAAGDRWFRAYCLNNLGSIACMLGNYDEARQHTQESYALREAFGDAEGMALARALLGKIALVQEQAEEAQRHYEHSLALYQELGDQGGLAASLNGLGMAACAQGACQDARSYLRQALQIAADMQFVPLLLTIVTSSAALLLQTGQSERGRELLECVLHHPASDREASQRAQQLLDGLPARTAAAPSTADHDLDTLVTWLLRDFPQMAVASPAATATPATASPTLTHPDLLDPLTEREADVLRLIVAGQSNKEIAATLVMTVGTIKWYASQIYSKLGVNSRAQAMVRAQELHLVD
jgi:predicted ATPase/DNA-binding CsgD family transcriptional regulator